MHRSLSGSNVVVHQTSKPYSGVGIVTSTIPQASSVKQTNQPHNTVGLFNYASRVVSPTQQQSQPQQQQQLQQQYKERQLQYQPQANPTSITPSNYSTTSQHRVHVLQEQNMNLLGSQSARVNQQQQLQQKFNSVNSKSNNIGFFSQRSMPTQQSQPQQPFEIQPTRNQQQQPTNNSIPHQQQLHISQSQQFIPNRSQIILKQSSQQPLPQLNPIQYHHHPRSNSHHETPLALSQTSHRTLNPPTIPTAYSPTAVNRSHQRTVSVYTPANQQLQYIQQQVPTLQPPKLQQPITTPQLTSQSTHRSLSQQQSPYIPSAPVAAAAAASSEQKQQPKYEQNLTLEEFTSLSSQPQTQLQQSPTKTLQKNPSSKQFESLGLTQIARQSLSQFANSNHYFSQTQLPFLDSSSDVLSTARRDASLAAGVGTASISPTNLTPRNLPSIGVTPKHQQNQYTQPQLVQVLSAVTQSLNSTQNLSLQQPTPPPYLSSIQALPSSQSLQPISTTPPRHNPHLRYPTPPAGAVGIGSFSSHQSIQNLSLQRDPSPLQQSNYIPALYSRSVTPLSNVPAPPSSAYYFSPLKNNSTVITPVAVVSSSATKGNLQTTATAAFSTTPIMNSPIRSMSPTRSQYTSQSPTQVYSPINLISLHRNQSPAQSPRPQHRSMNEQQQQQLSTQQQSQGIESAASISDQCDEFMKQIAQERVKRQQSAEKSTSQRQIISSTSITPQLQPQKGYLSQQSIEEPFQQSQQQQQQQPDNHQRNLKQNNYIPTISSPGTRLFSFDNFKPISSADDEVATNSLPHLAALVGTGAAAASAPTSTFPDDLVIIEDNSCSSNTNRTNPMVTARLFNDNDTYEEPVEVDQADFVYEEKTKKSAARSEQKRTVPPIAISSELKAQQEQQQQQQPLDDITIETMEREVEELEQRISSESPCSPNQVIIFLYQTETNPFFLQLSALSERRHQRKIGNALSHRILREIQAGLPQLAPDTSKSIAQRILTQVMTLINPAGAINQSQLSQQQLVPPFEFATSQGANNSSAGIANINNEKQISITTQYPSQNGQSIKQQPVQLSSQSLMQRMSTQSSTSLESSSVCSPAMNNFQQFDKKSQQHNNQLQQIQSGSQLANMVNSLAKMHPTLSPIRELENIENMPNSRRGSQTTISIVGINTAPLPCPPADVSCILAKPTRQLEAAREREEIIREINLFTPNESAVVTAAQAVVVAAGDQEDSGCIAASNNVTSGKNTPMNVVGLRTQKSAGSVHSRQPSRDKLAFSSYTPRQKGSLHEANCSGVTSNPSTFRYKPSSSRNDAFYNRAMSKDAKQFNEGLVVGQKKNPPKKPAESFATEYLRKQQMGKRKKEEEQLLRIKNTLLANRGAVVTTPTAVGASRK